MKIVLLIKGDPFSWKAHEALRVGLALGINHEVFIIFFKDGVYTLTRCNWENLLISGFEKLIENLEYVNVKLFVEDLSAEERGLKKGDFVKDVEFINIEQIKRILASSEAVLVW
ncbi:DsrE family protein [Thermocrinis jamiesonii]|jgi:Predicted peroxiredoxins|uniref:DsrE family protein n=1 Tax=Thermocrinis jamiesonii TaxID=1302351 RepID=UPI0004950F75|nr:DsrE family protein [Thermocrinis jamiesonii]